MNIEPGTRVRSTENIRGLDKILGFDKGVYIGREGGYYVIKWDNQKSTLTDNLYLHLHTEFEVI